MKKLLVAFLILPCLFITEACEKTEKDEEYPVIIMDGDQGFPHECDTLYLGSIFTFKAAFTDNGELGAYSISIHHNFDHHTHNTSMVECQLDPVKTPHNPLTFIQQYSIPPGQKEYHAAQTIALPSGFDPGDYHMMIQLTDRAGWQRLRGISIKILESDTIRNSGYTLQ